MKTHIVFVKFKMPGQSSLDSYCIRYIDSQWATSGHARDRKTELEGSMRMFAVQNSEVLILEGAVGDVGIPPTPTDAEAPR